MSALLTSSSDPVRDVRHFQANVIMQSALESYCAQLESEEENEAKKLGSKLFYDSNTRSITIQSYEEDEDMKKQPCPLNCEQTIAIDILKGSNSYLLTGMARTVNNPKSPFHGCELSFFRLSRHFWLMLHESEAMKKRKEDQRLEDNRVKIDVFVNDFCIRLRNTDDNLTQQIIQKLPSKDSKEHQLIIKSYRNNADLKDTDLPFDIEYFYLVEAMTNAWDRLKIVINDPVSRFHDMTIMLKYVDEDPAIKHERVSAVQLVIDTRSSKSRTCVLL